MDEQHCLEMFRRARQGDQHAQEWFQRHFRDIMRDWLDRHPGKESACRLHTEAYYLDRAFQSAWNGSLDGAELEFTSLATVLRFLRASLNGQILDAQRTLHKASSSRAQQTNDERDARQLWDQIQVMLPNERARRLGYLLYHCDLKPAEIVRAFPQEFNDVAEITQVRLAILRTGHGKLSEKA
jgi:hypothetical protein